LTYYAGKGLDVITVSGEFLLSFKNFGENKATRSCAAWQLYPELIFISQVKLAKVMRFEVGAPGEFARLGNKQAIIEKLEEGESWPASSQRCILKSNWRAMMPSPVKFLTIPPRPRTLSPINFDRRCISVYPPPLPTARKRP
jgi:hypothetical protein